MRLKPPLIVAALLVLGGQACMAQNVITSTGNYFTTTDVSLSWTLGEPLIETDVSSANYLTQGFQQPASIVITGVNNTNAQGSVNAYPNPFTNSFYVKNNEDGKTLWVELINMQGKTVFKKVMTAQEEQFDLSNYANGIYFLRVYNTDHQLIETLKVDKVK